MGLETRSADLAVLPTVEKNQSKHLTLGDLHGNALKLIYILIQENVLSLKREDDYKILMSFYSLPVNEIRLDFINIVKDILDKAQIVERKTITLIGDEVADRGANDYFTLLILDKLNQAGLNIEILLSNHGVAFLRDAENPHFTGIHHFHPEQGQSLVNMYQLIKKHPILEAEIKNIISRSYLPKIKPISYTVSAEGQLTLFTHAPVGVETVYSLAQKLKVEYRDKTITELCKTIDQINHQFTMILINKKLGALIQNEDISNVKPIDPRHPIARLTWNRSVDDELVCHTQMRVPVQFVHGHIGPGTLSRSGKQLSTHQNLDTLWGKGAHHHTGQYTCENGSTYHVDHLVRYSDDKTCFDLKVPYSKLMKPTEVLVDTTNKTYAAKEILRHAKDAHILQAENEPELEHYSQLRK